MFPARRLVATAMAVLAGAALLAAQQATFSARTTLLTVDVTVLDRGGKPVPGLSPDDFEVKLNGKVQPVRVAAFLEASTPVGTPALDATGLSETPARADNAGPRGESRVFVLLIDDAFIAPGSGQGLFTAASRFVARLPASDRVGFATTSGRGTVNPTRDRAPVLAALKKAIGVFFDPRTFLGGGPVVGIYESLQIDEGMNAILVDAIVRECGLSPQEVTSANVEELISDNGCAEETQRRARLTANLARRTTENQLQAYIAAIRALGTVGGIKQLVILTNGLGLVKSADLVPVATAAAEAGVQMSVLAEEPDGPQVADTSEGQAEARRADGRALLSMARTMTDMSGGQFFRVVGRSDRFFDRVLEAASAVYRLGVELPPDVPIGADLTVAARVRRSGLVAHATRHTVVPGPAPELTPDEQMRLAVLTGRPNPAVPVSLGAVVRRGEGGRGLQLAVSAAVPASVPGPLSTMFGLVDETGAARVGKRTMPAPDEDSYRMTFALPVEPGDYTLRLAVADATGAVGSVDLRISAKLIPMGPFTASDLLLWSTDRARQPQFLALEAVPAGVDTLHALLELYPPAMGTGPGEVWVKLSLVPLAGGASGAPVAQYRIAAVEADGMLRADAIIPIGTFPVGRYALRAVVTAGGNEVGTTAVTLSRRVQ
jgi:cyclophilin family peptidyl-prolyl cis-trans isomerase